MIISRACLILSFLLELILPSCISASLNGFSVGGLESFDINVMKVNARYAFSFVSVETPYANINYRLHNYSQ